MISVTMIVGPRYHNSHEKHELNARVARELQPAAFMLLRHAHSFLSSLYGAKILFAQERNGHEIWKLQTLDRPDYPSPEDAIAARILARQNPGTRLIQDIALDELPQVFQVSLDPEQPSGTSVVAVRTIMDSDNGLLRRAVGRVRHNDWQEVVHEMGHGLFSAYGSFSDEARQQSLAQTTDHTTHHWMQRYDMDMWQYNNGSAELDMLILNGTLALGGMRVYAHEHGKFPDAAMTVLRGLGMST